MSSANHIFTDPVTGSTFTFTKTRSETNGASLTIEAHFGPHSIEPAMHYHPYQQENFAVVTGSLTVQLNDKQHVFHAGETFDVPPGVHHAIWNASHNKTHVIWQIEPAMQSQAFLETAWGLTADGKTGANGVPNLLQATVMMRAYDDEFRLVSPPRPLMNLLTWLLAPIGRLLGYRASYTQYSG